MCNNNRILCSFNLIYQTQNKKITFLSDVLKVISDQWKGHPKNKTKLDLQDYIPQLSAMCEDALVKYNITFLLAPNIFTFSSRGRRSFTG